MWHNALDMHSHAAIVKHSLIQLGGRGIGIIFGLLTLGIMARALGDVGYGEYTTAITYLQLWAIVGDLGLTLTFSQMISEPGAEANRIAKALLGLRLLLAAIVLGIGTAIAFALPYSPMVRLIIVAGVLSYLSLAATSMVIGVFQKHLAMQRAVASEMVNRVLTLVFIFLIAWNGYGVIAMMAAISISNVIQLFLTIGLARRFVHLRPSIDGEIWRRAITQSWPIGISIFFNLLYLKSDILILGIYKPLSEVGIYGAGYRVIDVVTALPTMFMGVALPVFVRLWKQKDIPELHTLLQKILDLFCLVALPLAIGSLFISAPLMTAIAGTAFTRSGPVLAILILAAIPLFLSAMFGHVIVAIEKQRMMLWGYAATAAVAFLLYFTLIPRYGIFGAAWSTVATETLIALLTGIVVMRPLSYRPRLGMIAKILVASTVMAAVLWVLPPIHYGEVIIVGAIVYTGSLLALGVRTSIKDLLGIAV